MVLKLVNYNLYHLIYKFKIMNSNLWITTGSFYITTIVNYDF